MRRKLDTVAVGLAFGITWAVGILLIGFYAWLSASESAITLVNLVGKFYIGYAPAFFGSIIGAIWGFIDGFLCGLIFAWLYNKFSKN